MLYHLREDRMGHRMEVKEAYRNYRPPRWVRPTVDRVLGAVAEQYLAGLKTVVLTNAGGLNHNRRRARTRARKKKIRISDTRGLYHQKWKGQPAWIELFVDNLLEPWPSQVLWLALFRDMAVTDVLLHELGHHIHASKVPRFREKEDVAEGWRLTLQRPYYLRWYWYVFGPAAAAGWVRRKLFGAGKRTARRSS